MNPCRLAREGEVTAELGTAQGVQALSIPTSLHPSPCASLSPGPQLRKDSRFNELILSSCLEEQGILSQIISPSPTS